MLAVQLCVSRGERYRLHGNGVRLRRSQRGEQAVNFPKQFRKEALEGRETRRGYVCLLFAFNVPAPEGPELLKRARGCTRVSGVSCAAGVESAGLQSRLSLTCGLGIFLSLLNEPLVFFWLCYEN